MGEISGVRRKFVRAAMDAPFLEREEERALAVRWKEERRRGRAPPPHRGAYAARHRACGAVPALRAAHGRSRPGGPCRPPRGGRPVRAGARGALLHLCDLVDPRLDPGLHPAQLVDRPRRHEFGPEGAVLQPAPPAGPPHARRRGADRRRGPRQDRRGDRRLPRRRGADGRPPVGSRYLPQRADARRGARQFGRAGGVPGRQLSAAGREGQRRHRYASGACAGCSRRSKF